MSTSSPKISVIIATYNSEKTLPLVLNALIQQTVPRSTIEVLLVDGGSKDATRSIGKEFGCTIINNPRTEPLHAKFLGYKKAKGKYILYLDHDEVLQNKDSLKIRIACLEKEKRVKAVLVSGYENPQGYPFINNYINDFGDPFSFFIYRLSKNSYFFLSDMKKRYKVVKDTKTYTVFNLRHASDTPIIELCAGGSMFDSEYMKRMFPETLKTSELIPHFFYLLDSTDSFIAISKMDAIMHYSSDTLRKYLNKIRWRVKNNIYHTDYMGKAGYTGREEYHSGMKLKKYLFIPYVYTIVVCFFDAVSLSLSRQNPYYLLHLPLSIFTANLIMYHSIRKLAGYRHELKSYDESRAVLTN